ncbi:MAG TPA: ATP-binding protein, partial [Bryobacteraceae bacterium]|nr:ATP-binding protein [Bryobacteraceae bacterium]
MKSLFAKILVWFGCTMLITLVGSAFISALSMNLNDTDEHAPWSRLMRFQLEEARTAYETGGRPELEAYLETLHHSYDAQGILTDDKGRDVLTGEDRSGLVRLARLGAPRFTLYRFLPLGVSTLERASADGKYWFFFIVPRSSLAPAILTWEHLFVLAAAVLLCYWLALHLTSPVRSLQKAVERFGGGDFTARVGSARRDELGQLANTFDRMAGRIETLLAAERRLLLDISHELRSPLARLGVAVELARSGEDRDAALNRIQKESDRLNALLNLLLQVTRAEGDPRSLRRDHVRLDELVLQLVDDSAIEASAHGCQLEYRAGEPVTVEGDAELLRRAMENVIRNAIRYSPPKTAVEITLGRRNGTAVVDVRDHGPGVPEEALPRLFDAFYRVEKSRDTASGGIGLGLSIARRALELHKGGIRARNAQPGLEVEM